MASSITQATSVTACQNMGGVLAPVRNSNDQACVASTFDLVSLFYFSVVLPASGYVWIGIERTLSCMMDMASCWYTINNNQPVRRYFLFSKIIQLTWTNWNNGEPNQHTQGDAYACVQVRNS